MRLRALGMAMMMFGMAGALASWGAWFLKYRYFHSAAELAVNAACTEHCHFDAPFTTAAIISGAVALVGAVVAVSQLAAGGRHRGAEARGNEGA